MAATAEPSAGPPFIKRVLSIDETGEEKHVESGGLFETLSEGVAFEAVAKGREGAILLAVSGAGEVPVVRSTTKYVGAHQRLRKAHSALLENIVKQAPVPGLVFNNVMIERYDWQYRTMGFHSDQAVDLADDSYICLFSCYSNPHTSDLRALVVCDKTNEAVCTTIVLDHKSIVLFSTNDNPKFLHKIVPVNPATSGKHVDKSSVWLGMTCRLSKRAVRFVDGVPMLQPGVPFTQADKVQAKRFYALRSEENRSKTAYEYPEDVTYTISPSDLLPPLD